MKHISFFSVIIFIMCLFAAFNLSAQQTEIQYLSGQGSDDAVDWEFMCTDGRNSGKWTTIKVPSCWELQGFGTYQYGMPFYGKANPPGIATEQGLYKYRFKLPKEWEGRIIKIVFDGVMTDCSVNINGRPAVKLHQGAFYRFESDITDRVFTGNKENLLEVTVSKESANQSVNLAERRADYWNFGGIFRPVFIKALPAQHIDRLTIDAKANGDFSADVFLGYAAAKDVKVRVAFSDKDGKNIGTSDFALSTGSDNVRVSQNLKNIKPWTAETPELYFATFSLLDNNNKTLHTVKERFGFRTIEVREGDGLYINGQKMLVRGVNRHSFRPETGRTLNKTANYEDVRLMKSMNMNAVRMSHYPPDSDFLAACDELGLYVMNELGGWHGMYDSNVGRKLVREMLVRDVNHPSIIWWANGNEGGHNHELDSEFWIWDLQKRPVLHPQKNFGGFETMHYRSYGESLEYMRKPEIFMPTEFLHGLYDGGHGAGLWDYWEIMRRHTRSAGGFLWVFADEGVVRTDQNGRIDNVGNYGADGIVGPHHEKEGSYYTIKQIWSPVQITNCLFSDNSSVTFDVENRYDFTNLNECKFEWTLKSFADRKEKIINKGNVKVNMPPQSDGQLKVDLPTNWKDADALYLAVYDKNGEELWTWDWKIESPKTDKTNTNKVALNTEEKDNNLTVVAGNVKLFFDKKTGKLNEVLAGNQKKSLGGIDFIAARRGDRSFDVYYNHDDKESRSKERVYFDVSAKSVLKDFAYEKTADSIVVTSKYLGDLVQTRWVILADGKIRLDYEYEFNGTVELMGVKFNYPENQMISKQWLGAGAYRVWQNRMHGTKYGIWEVDYNDPIPGETFVYPEFKGYFAAWQWVTFTTTEGKITLTNGDKDSFLGVYTPRDGRDVLLYTLPESEIAILKVIPAVRNKVNSTDLNGPSAQAKWAQGKQQGSVWLEF
jgi:Beta-galactosidase/beta-glucuronidase